MKPACAAGVKVRKIETQQRMLPTRLTRYLIRHIQIVFGVTTKNTAANQRAVRRYAVSLADAVVCGSELDKQNAIEEAITWSVFPSPRMITAQRDRDIAAAFSFFAHEQAPAYSMETPIE
jgi:hypothetical protein